MARIKALNPSPGQCEAIRKHPYHNGGPDTDRRCKWGAKYEVNGLRLCQKHARSVALEILTKGKHMTKFDLIRQWAVDRNLVDGSNPQAQTVKLIEEIGELAAGVARGDQARIEDGVGDAVVVLTILASQTGLRIEDCIEAAWSEIKDRKGRMVDGVFIKEGD